MGVRAERRCGCGAKWVGGCARARISCHTRLHRRTLLHAAEAAGETPTSALQGFGLFYMEWYVGLAALGLRRQC